jgi:hypothetical protein
MPNLQALAADNETIIYLAADGDGFEASPFKSIFAAEQYGAWTITVDNQLTGYATELKQDEILVELGTINAALAGTLAVETELEQPITDSQLRAAPINVSQSSLPGLRIPDHDTIELSYTGSDLTNVVYKLAGVTVATLTLAYTDGNLTSVTRS